MTLDPRGACGIAGPARGFGGVAGGDEVLAKRRLARVELASGLASARWTAGWTWRTMRAGRPEFGQGATRGRDGIDLSGHRELP